jgi:hypothetical protein
MGDIIMFTMVSSSPNQVAPRANRCLGGQFACAPMYYVMFWTIVDATNGCLGGGLACVLAMRKGFTYDLILNYQRIRYFHPQPRTTMVFPT